MTTTVKPPANSSTNLRLLAATGLGTVITSVMLIAGLDLYRLFTDSRFLKLTISEYALTELRWIFDVAVGLLAVGSVLILYVLVRHGLTRWLSGFTVATGLWSVGLITVMIFPKQDWSLPETIIGHIHRIGSLVAFISLPIAAILLAKRWLTHDVWSRTARRIRIFGWLSAATFAPIIYTLIYAAITDAAWWRVLPLGYIERLLVVCEVMTMLAIGFWALAGASPQPTLQQSSPESTEQPANAT